MKQSASTIVSAPEPLMKPLLQLAVIGAVSLGLGAVTSYAQGFLPEWISPLANSSSGWTLLTVLLIWSLRARPAASLLLGAVSFVSLVLGYTIMSELRGLPYSPVFFGVIGAIAGPVVGLAASWLHRRGLRAAVGAGALAGIGLGEAVYGHLIVSATTGTTYWNFIGLLSLALLTVTAIRRFEPLGRCIIYALGTTAAAAAGFFMMFNGLIPSPLK